MDRAEFDAVTAADAHVRAEHERELSCASRSGSRWPMRLNCAAAKRRAISLSTGLTISSTRRALSTTTRATHVATTTSRTRRSVVGVGKNDSHARGSTRLNAVSSARWLAAAADAILSLQHL